MLSGVLQRYQEQRRPLTSARDRLAWLVDGLFDYYSAHPERMRLMAVVINLHPELFGRTLESFLQNRMLVPLEVLAGGMHCGELRKAHPLEFWWSILGVCMFSMMLQPIAHRFHPAGMPAPALDLAARRGQILDLLVNGMARPARRKKS